VKKPGVRHCAARTGSPFGSVTAGRQAGSVPIHVVRQGYGARHGLFFVETYGDSSDSLDASLSLAAVCTPRLSGYDIHRKISSEKHSATTAMIPFVLACRNMNNKTF
jgi:hypothetical protein